MPTYCMPEPTDPHSISELASWRWGLERVNESGLVKLILHISVKVLSSTGPLRSDSQKCWEYYVRLH
jgi:hypothetical protein